MKRRNCVTDHRLRSTNVYRSADDDLALLLIEIAHETGDWRWHARHLENL